MTVIADDTSAVARTGLYWPAIFAGALLAATLAMVLHSFAAAIGLAVSSTAPTWRDSSFALWLLSGIYLVLVAVAAYGVGGYLAGWIRAWSGAADEGAAANDTTNGIHGLLVWAVATLISALIVAATVLVSSSLAAPSGGNAGPNASVGGEKIIAYDIDRLFRTDGRYPQTDYARARSEADRILLTASSHSGVSTEDRQYLTRLVSAQTNLSAADAERRVDATIVRARDNINRARRSAVILAFMAGAAALLGAVVAWFATATGAKHAQDQSLTPIWSNHLWSPRRASTFP